MEKLLCLFSVLEICNIFFLIVQHFAPLNRILCERR